MGKEIREVKSPVGIVDALVDYVGVYDLTAVGPECGYAGADVVVHKIQIGGKKHAVEPEIPPSSGFFMSVEILRQVHVISNRQRHVS